MKALAGIIVALSLLTSVPASASDAGPRDRTDISATHMAAAIVTDFSAVRRKRSVTATTPQQAAPVWTGADPTKGPGIERMREEQRQGRCVIDEGYGRFTYCDAW